MVTAADLERLLPAVHRLRDAASPGAGAPGGPLHDLLAVLAEQADVVDADVDRLADAWFIETCADWLVPYLGDLLAATPLHPIGTGATRPRAAVANTLGYRQRKGTLAVLEDVARDVTGWPTRAVEAFALLAWTQALAHVRPERTGTPDLRTPELARRRGGPDDRAPRTLDVRNPSRGGRYGPDVVVLFVHRLQPLTTEDAQAVRSPTGTGRWHLDPFGVDVPLFRRPADAGSGPATEAQMPGPLARAEGGGPLFRLQTRTAGGPWAAVEPVVPCDLTGWRAPPAGAAAAVDPLLGRVTTRDELPVLRATATTAAASPLGGGPHDRRDRATPSAAEPAARRYLVGRDLVPDRGVFTSIAAALDRWRSERPPGPTEVVVSDSAVYGEPFPGTGSLDLVLQPGQELRLVAATAPVPPSGEEPDPAPPADRLGVRPVLAAPLVVRGDGRSDGEAVGGLVLDGLWCTRPVQVGPGDLARLALYDTTVAPQADGASLEVAGPGPGRPRTDNPDLTVELVRCVVGAVHLAGSRGRLRLDTVLVHGRVRAEHVEVTVDDSTVDGRLTCQLLARASNSLFTGPLTVARRQAGCLRYSFVPDGSTTPPRYRCQPDLALAAATDPASGTVPPDRAAVVRARVRPVFTSLAFRHPAAGQLAGRCPPELAEGAEDGAEMGVHRALRQPQRRENLAMSLDEYLRAGLQAAVVAVT